MAEVVRDDRHANMWRFRLLPDGKLSDMVNLSRAKDAAHAHVLARLNRRECDAAPPRIAPDAPAAALVAAVAHAHG